MPPIGLQISVFITISFVEEISHECDLFFGDYIREVELGRSKEWVLFMTQKPGNMPTYTGNLTTSG